MTLLIGAAGVIAPVFTAARIGFTAAQNPSSNRTRKYQAPTRFASKMVRSSLGNAALTSTKARYPMYVIPVKALLELDAWQPHQALLAQGMVMIIEGAGRPLKFFNPCDTFKLRSSRGAFSVDDDRAVVNKTLASMLRAKAASFAALGDVSKVTALESKKRDVKSQL